MLYIEYEEYKAKYYEAQRKYDVILCEKEKLFSETQPKATNYSAEKVKGGEGFNNSWDTYLINVEEKNIDARLKVAKSILEDREMLLNMKKQELRLSNNIYDKIYIAKILENMRVNKIPRVVNYSEPQVYRILKIIRKNIKMIGNDRKKVLE